MLVIKPLLPLARWWLRVALWCATGLFSLAHGQPGPPLRALIDHALATHPSVQSQTAMAQAAQAGLDAARWQFFPTPSASVQRSSLQAGDPLAAGNRIITTAGLSQPLWTWGRLQAGMDKAQAQLAQAEASRAESMQQTALRVTQAYGEWLSAHQKAQAYAQGLQLQERLTEQVRRRIEEGQAAPSDQALADGRRASLRADLKQAQVQAQGALARLSSLSGLLLDPAQLADSLASPWPLPDVSLQQLLLQAEENSPVLGRLQAQVMVLEASARELQARTKPELQARLEWQSGNNFNQSTAVHARAYVGMSTQLGAGLSSLSAVADALARRDAAQADWQAQRLALAEQMTTDHLMVSGAPQRRADLLSALKATEGVVQSWGRQYLAGRKTWQDLMNSVREEVQLRAQIADFDASQLVATWRIALMTGLILATGAARTP